MYIQHRSHTCPLGSSLSLPLMLFHRSQHAAGTCLECMALAEPLTLQYGGRSCFRVRSVVLHQRVQVGALMVRWGRAKSARASYVWEQMCEFNEWSKNALATLFMLMVRRRLVTVWPITAESLSIRVRTTLSLFPVRVANTGS